MGAVCRLAYVNDPDAVAHMRHQLKMVAMELADVLKQKGGYAEAASEVESLLLQTAFRVGGAMQDHDPVEAMADVIAELLETVPILARRVRA